MTPSITTTQMTVTETVERVEAESPFTHKPADQPIKWANAIAIPIYHLVALYSIYDIIVNLRFTLALSVWFFGYMGGLGVTAGAHRLWTHRSYKAKAPLQIILLSFFSMAGQNTVPQWVLDHRVHHKYSDTDADPHNSSRGFFYSHVGWLMMKKHPDVLRKGKAVDMSDIYADPLIMFHTRYFVPLKILFCYIIPTSVPVLLWNETWKVSMLANVLRHVLSLNVVWSVNSVAHIWGNKPYHKGLRAVQNIGVAIMAIGEGWHNYHHAFPWDYRTSEWNYFHNMTTVFIDMFAQIGWAYELRKPSDRLIEATVRNHGDPELRQKSL